MLANAVAAVPGLHVSYIPHCAALWSPNHGDGANTFHDMH